MSDNKLTNKYIEILDNINQSIEILNQQKVMSYVMCFDDYFIEIRRLKKMEKLINKILLSYGCIFKENGKWVISREN